MDTSRRNLVRGALAAPLALAAAPASAQDMLERCRRELLPTLDFAGLARFRDHNARLLASKAPVDIVFLGDSITAGWRDKRPAFFESGRINRGISGQTTPQMLLRMMADVVELKPSTVHIMAGTNDIAGNTGPMTPDMIQDNFRAMSAISRQHGIQILLASIPPAASFPWRPGVETRGRIAEMNAWLEQFAKASGAVWVDYGAVLDDGTGAMKPDLAHDGVHPTEAGYDAMVSVIEPLLARLPSARRRA